jgi:lipopolysaccharide/colanic/teichoic acid biosynthesis glycosyltransferase
MYQKFFKRLLDIVLSMIGIAALSWLMLVIAILVKLTSKGPIIFKQERLSRNGDTFKMYKFRSMVVGAEKQGVYADNNDPRLTPIGKMIRATSIDELPQLFNIFKGDMSFVGPRPILTYHPWPFDQYTDSQKQIFDVRPGITGWAQVNGRKEVQWEQRIALNIWYVQNISFLLDMKIIVMTIQKVLLMKNNQNVGETVEKSS